MVRVGRRKGHKGKVNVAKSPSDIATGIPRQPSQVDDAPISLTQSKLRRSFLRYWVLLSATVLLLVVLPGGGYLYLARESSLPQAGISGVEILSDCKSKTRAFLTLQPHFKEGYSEVSIGLENAKEVLPSCTTLKFLLPSPTGSHSYLLPSHLPNEPGFEPNKDLRPLHRPIKDIFHDPLGFDVVTILLKDYPDFTGHIYYLWAGGPKRVSYSGYNITLSFSPLRIDGESLEPHDEFRVSMPARDGYALAASRPTPSAHKTIGDLSFYWFDLGRQESTLSISFEQQTRGAKKRFWMPILLSISAGGLLLLIAEFVGMQRANSEKGRRLEAA
jgi:hypothetical protein